MVRQRTQLESEGAEFLVLGLLLVEGIEASKSYRNYPGYDILAVNPDKGHSCRIQVKTRWATDNNRYFFVGSTDCDFFVFVQLNRGYRYSKRLLKQGTGKKAPTYFVIPKPVVEKYRKRGRPSVINLSSLPDVDDYAENWDQIRSHIYGGASEPRAAT